MTKSELIEIVSNRAPNFPKRDVEMIVNTMFETMTQSLSKHERIEIRGFGSFVAKERRARDGRNPRTGVKVPVPQKWVPFFTAGKELRVRVNDRAGGPMPADVDDDEEDTATPVPTPSTLGVGAESIAAKPLVG